jgi:CHAT domain-containing protein
LLEALKEYQSDIRSGVEAALLDEERRIQASLNIKEQQWRSALASPQGAAKATQSRREMDALLDQFKLLQGEIRVRSPRYAALTQPESISLENLQRNLDENSVLLEYWLGYERSFLWTVTTNEVRTYVLPPARHIEQTARDYFVALSKAPPSATSKPQDHSTADAARHASSLSVTLMGPAAGTLSTKRLIIVSHGALQYLPFAALPAPASNTTTGGLLIERHEIVNLPSASVLPVLRANPAGARQQSYWLYSPTRFSPRKMHGCVVRLAPIRARSIRSCSPKTKSCSDRPAIPAWMGFVVYASAGSRRMQSLRWFPAESRFQAVDFQASRTTALSPGLADYRILHFATHGLANNVRPEFSGLVFSTVDARGKPQDGMLRLHEIFNLSLKAELVVLSACQTALGREIRGEGLIGLTRGFMHAGTPRVVASLWNVEDRATAELMKRFYEGMFKRQLKPAAALRAAQIALQQDKRWSAPYYWAGFTLQGEWQ